MADSNLLIHKMWDITVVNFEDARILEVSQINSIGEELFKLVDEQDRKKLILDMSKVQFLASAAVGMMITLHKKVTAAKGQMVVCGLKKQLMVVFEIMKLTKVFKFAANEDEGLKIMGYSAARG